MVTNSRSAISSVTFSSTTCVAVFLPDVADRYAAHQRVRLRPGEKRARDSAQRDIGQHGQQRDPGDVGQDHVHREVAAHQEDAVAEPLGRRRWPRPRSGTARPSPATGAARRSAAAAAAAAPRAATICQVEAPSVCALIICSRGQFADPQRQVAHMNGAMPNDDQRDLRRSRPGPNTMNRIGSTASGGIIADGADEAATAPPAHSGIRPIASPSTSADRRRRSPGRAEPLEAGAGVGPEQVVAGALVGLERHGRAMASTMVADGGSSLSFGFSASRSRRGRPR